MKLKLLFTTLIGLLFLQLSAQSGCPQVNTGPDQTLNCNETCADISATVFDVGQTTSYVVNSIAHAPPISYNAAGGTAVSVNTDDVWSNVITLPFPFCFFGQTYTTCKIGSNGAIQLGPVSGGGYHPWPFSASVPSSDLVQAGNIFGPYHDIDPSVSGSVKYYLTGSAPCRTLIVTYNNLAHYDCNSLKSTFMMVLYETTNIIETYINNKPTCGGWNSGNAVIGIQNPAGTVGYTPPGRNTGSWSVNTPEAWSFKPDGAPIYSTVEWFEGSTSIGTGNTINVCPTNPINTYTAKTTYTRCDGLEIHVEDDIKVDFQQPPALVVSPANAFSCSGQNIDLTALTAVPVSYAWTPTGLTTQSISVSPTTTTEFSCTVTDLATGCIASDTVSVSIAQPTNNACNVFYVSTSGIPTANGTKSDPLDLETAIMLGACNGTTIKMATGDYVTDTAITGITSYLTLEGGFDEGVNWEKVSTVGATRILRTATMSTSMTTGSNSIIYGVGIENESGPAPKIVAIDISNQTGFRFQDITIETEDFTGQSAIENYQGVSTYGVQLTSCSDYNFVRTTILAGAASNGYDQVFSLAATNGGSSVGINATLNGLNGNVINSNVTAGTAGSGGAGSPSGANGNSSNITVSGSPLATQDDAFDLVSQAIIRMDDVSCANTLMNFSNTSSDTWSFGSNSLPPTAVGDYVSTQYATIGRKDINFGTDLYTGFSNILLDDQDVPAFTTSAQLVNGKYRICTGELVGFTASNGDPAYVYNWDLGANALPQSTYYGLGYDIVGGSYNVAGVYTISLNYETNCCGQSIATTIELYVDETPVITGPQDQDFCFGQPGGVELNVIGGTTNGSISWSPSNGLSNTNSYNVVSLPSSTTNYIATVSDSTGNCSVHDTVIVSVTDLDLAVISSSSTCLVQGTAGVTVSGGSGDYSYAWSNGDNIQNITGLQPGDYTVVVTDNISACSDSALVNVAEGPGVVVATTEKTDISCFGGADGSITVSVVGGVGPYTYAWTPGTSTGPIVDTFDSRTGLAMGLYSIEVTDATGCFYTITDTIFESSEIVFSIDSLIAPICVGLDSGYVEIRPDGGVRPYTLSWSNGMSVVEVNDVIFAENLAAGNYTLYLIDALGCEDSVLIDLNALLVGSTMPDTICSGDIYTVPSGATFTPANDIVLLDTIPSIIGCDSVITVNLVVNPRSTDTLVVTICDGETHLMPDGASQGVEDDYLFTYPNSFDCDSLYVVQLRLLPIYDELLNEFICADETFVLPGGDVVSESGVYHDTLMTVSGCDSVFKTNLVVFETHSTLVDTVMAENNQSYILPDGTTISSEGEYETLLISASGCDSLVTTKIRVVKEWGIPNIFSPNADQEENRVFSIVNEYGLVELTEMQIFNRWGQKVFDMQESGLNYWDGYYDGILQSAGNYAYILKVKDEKGDVSETYSGNFLLVW